MGQTPGDKSQPSLELPSLSPFGRRKKEKEKKSRKRAGRAVSANTTTGPTPEPTPEPTEVLRPAQDPTPADVPLDEPPPQAEPVAATGPAAVAEPVAPADPGARRTRKSRAGRSAPRLPGSLASALTGVLVGAAGAGATYGAMTGCEIVRGVSTCGGAPGFFILVAIFALMVLLGGGILRLFRAESPGSTSFLAVGVVAVVVMLALLDVIFSAWMFAVIPALSAAAYLLAHWVTTRFDEESTGRRDWT